MKQIPECPTRLPARIGEMIRELGSLWATSEVWPRIDTATKTDWNAMLREWIDDCSIPLLVRRASLVRGSVSKHASGREIVPTDNSPARWACHLALYGTVPTIQKIRDDFGNDEGAVLRDLRQRGKDCQLSVRPVLSLLDDAAEGK